MKTAPITDLKTFRVDYQTYQTKLTKKFEHRMAWEKPDRREVCAYIPGSVVNVIAKEGESLRAGARLLTFEAMKMLCTLTMPYDGVVKKIHVKAGDRVRKSKVLIEIDDAENGTRADTRGEKASAREYARTVEEPLSSGQLIV